VTDIRSEMVSPKVTTIIPNRNFITVKVIFVSFGVLILFDMLLNPEICWRRCKSQQKQGIAILPSLPPVTHLKCWCTGRLRHGRESDCPSRYPPFFKFAPSCFFKIHSKQGVRPQWEDEGPWTGGRREGYLFTLPSVSACKQMAFGRKGRKGG